MQARLATAGAPLARLGDWLIPLGLAAFGLYETLGKAPPVRGAKLLQTLGVLVVAVPLLWRRRAPLAVLAVVVVGFAVAWPAERSSGGVTFTAVFGLLIAVFSVGAYAQRARAVPVVAVAGAMVAAMLAADVRAGYLRPADAAGSFLFFAVGFYAGELVRARHLRALALEERAAALERERDERARAAVAEERTRMARELHDVLAHSLSTMVLQAGASRQVLRSDLEAVEELLLSIERTGREAWARCVGFLASCAPATMSTAAYPTPPLPASTASSRRPPRQDYRSTCGWKATPWRSPRALTCRPTASSRRH
jgi:signal transduction histidine kinase